MKNLLLRPLLAVLPITLSTFTISSPGLAATYYDNPTLRARNGRNYQLSVCIHSYRFPTQEDKCSKVARDLAAYQFCQFKGHQGWEYYRHEDVGWDNRRTAFWWTEKYIQGELSQGFRTAPDTSGLFSLIVCR